MKLKILVVFSLMMNFGLYFGLMHHKGVAKQRLIEINNLDVSLKTTQANASMTISFLYNQLNRMAAEIRRLETEKKINNLVKN